MKKTETTHLQIVATRALLKFCVSHGLDVANVDEIRRCLNALERDNLKLAIECFKRVPLGGMGCFNDWIPPVVFSGEDQQYVSDLFEILVFNWSYWMKLLIQ